jgi:hypothetical protein
LLPQLVQMEQRESRRSENPEADSDVGKHWTSSRIKDQGGHG